MSKQIWHNLSIHRTLEELKTNKNGLSFGEVNERIKKYGPNELPAEKKFSAYKRSENNLRAHWFIF